MLFPVGIDNPYYIHLLETIMIYAILLFGLDIVVGYTGQVSLGHAGLFGIGAYTAGVLVFKLGAPLLVALLAAIGVTALFGALLALPALRVTGPYLAMVTLAFGTIIQILINEMSFLTEGPMGIKLEQAAAVRPQARRARVLLAGGRAAGAVADRGAPHPALAPRAAPSRRCAAARWRRTAWACRCTATRSTPS